jgi:hypothetical protein
LLRIVRPPSRSSPAREAGHGLGNVTAEVTGEVAAELTVREP